MNTVPADDYRPFERPSMKFNRAADFLTGVRRPRTATCADLNRWRAASLDTLKGMGAREDVLARIATEGEWCLSDSKAPPDVWCGELRLSKSGAGGPRVTFFLDSVWGRTPTRRLFEHLSQIGVDHMVGHLYPYYAGEDDFGEAVACRYQYLMLRARADYASWASAIALPTLHWLHKRIPLSTYRT